MSAIHPSVAVLAVQVLARNVDKAAGPRIVILSSPKGFKVFYINLDESQIAIVPVTVLLCSVSRTPCSGWKAPSLVGSPVPGRRDASLDPFL